MRDAFVDVLNLQVYDIGYGNIFQVRNHKISYMSRTFAKIRMNVIVFFLVPSLCFTRESIKVVKMCQMET